LLTLSFRTASSKNHDLVIGFVVKNYQHVGKLVSNQFIVLILTLLLDDDDSDTIVLRKHDKIETLIDLTNDVVFFPFTSVFLFELWVYKEKAFVVVLC